MEKKFHGPILDAIIVGAGPAGLSASLILGRCLRNIVLLKYGPTRNAASQALHGFLTRDGIHPQQFLKSARQELSRYKTVKIISQKAVKITGSQRGFRVVLKNGKVLQSKKVLLATGLQDELPSIPNLKKFYGISIHHCPYCDAWEWRDHSIAVYGSGQRGLKLALSLRRWSSNLTLVTDGPAKLNQQDRDKLNHWGIRIKESFIKNLEGEGAFLKKILFQDDSQILCDALFFNTGSHPCSDLARQLDCSRNARGGILTRRGRVLNVPGLYAAGNILRDVQLVIVAAAEGAKAAFQINSDLQCEELKK